MTVLSFIYRFASNFILFAIVYFSLNYLDKPNERAIVALLFLAYAGMRTVSLIRTFFFYHQIERLEEEVRRTEGGARKQIVADVGRTRQHSEYKAYIDLLFLALSALICLTKIFGA